MKTKTRARSKSMYAPRGKRLATHCLLKTPTISKKLAVLAVKRVATDHSKTQPKRARRCRLGGRNEMAAKRPIDRAILAIYSRYPHVVNDDALLLDAVWRLLGWDETKSLLDNLKKLPRPESITRASRRLHEQGHIIYSKEALKRRTDEFNKARGGEYSH